MPTREMGSLSKIREEGSMKNTCVVFVTITLVFFISARFVGANDKAEKAALASAGDWLSLVDQGKYSESWDQAAEYFRNAVTKEQWSASLKAVRPPLGKVISRKVKGKQYARALPGAPDGEYVVIQYETQFENKKSATETVTPMLDKDGKWKVSGYFIK